MVPLGGNGLRNITFDVEAVEDNDAKLLRADQLYKQNLLRGII